MVKAEEMAGQKIGNMTVIGDTGKRGKNREVIALTVDDEGKYREVNFSNLFHHPQSYTGYVGSEEHKKTMSKTSKIYAKKANENKIKDGSLLDNISDGLSNRNKTGYFGILWNDQDKKWQYSLRFKNKIYRKSFGDFKKTVIERNKLAIKICNPYLKKHNYRLIEKINEKDILKNDYVKDKDKLIKNKNDKESKQSLDKNGMMYGYYFCKSRNKFRVYSRNGSKKKYFGQFNSEKEAMDKVEKIISNQTIKGDY